ncbi:3-deoxy-7-phosphoheptulonate synthase [Candidatus Bathyarchaeota archaeon]|nr:3-deoxy-7-phosphoheptulonate synthase [Candidatus Bathyarchaeota archaeon]MBS7631325.1 3-deoxy-7-phosphoheptulonate synthase [Candidatus Bathyarchaeota archaeon]
MNEKKSLRTKVSPELQLSIKHQNRDSTRVRVGGFEIGGNHLVVIAGPCSVESREQLLETARSVKESGASMLRGGAFKPRTLPYSFQGHGVEALKLLQEAKAETGLPIVTEVMSVEDVGLVERYSDMLQIGARNMQNYPLLKRVGKTSSPILLKRGLSATIEEFLGAAEYILKEGNWRVVLCERGIRTFEPLTRFTLDLSAVAVLKQISHLPIIVDPSHGTGWSSLVPQMAKAALAAGSDGIIVEVHPHPEKALSDGQQSLSIDEFRLMMQGLREIAKAVGRTI